MHGVGKCRFEVSVRYMGNDQDRPEAVAELMCDFVLHIVASSISFVHHHQLR